MFETLLKFFLSFVSDIQNINQKIRAMLFSKFKFSTTQIQTIHIIIENQVLRARWFERFLIYKSESGLIWLIYSILFLRLLT